MLSLVNGFEHLVEGLLGLMVKANMVAIGNGKRPQAYG
ncbi:hypothetical protein HRbin36_02385 [bacterium HR36]|nr:hypothetical protein HRbin36_02385 [bacterium HR36]